MANIPARGRHIIYDWSTYNTDIPLDGEREYFDSIITDQQNNLSVLGDGTNQAVALPFLEFVRIHATGNVNLNDLRIAGNRVTVYNTTAGTITVNINTTASPVYIHLLAGNVIHLYFNGSNWKNFDIFVFHATANMSLEDLRVTGTRVLVYNTTGATITVDLGTTGVPDTKNLPAYNLLYVYFNGAEWQNIGGHVHNNEYFGLPYMLDESDRPNAFVLVNGSQVSPNWTDVDFSAYVPTGEYLKGLILYGRLTFTGNGALNNVQAYIRQNGSAETDNIRTRVMGSGYSSLGAGVLLKTSSIFPVLCDTSGIIEYIVSDAQASLTLTILGYYLESRL